MQRATCKQQTTDNVAKTACNGQQATRQQTAGGLRHAGNTAQKTASSRQRMQQTTCIRQQTACRRTRAHARCNRKHTALPHFVCGEQRAAENQQYARSIVLDNKCATRHRRHTRCNTRPYDPCRSMHQTQTEPTTRSRRCNVRDETNEIRTLAHLGARCAGGGGVGLIVGLGLPESDVTVESCNSQNWAFGFGGTDCAKSDVPNPQAKTRSSASHLASCGAAAQGPAQRARQSPEVRELPDFVRRTPCIFMCICCMLRH